MPSFRHTFTVQAPLSAVAAFHYDTRALKRLTPPPLFIQLHRFDPLADGAEADFTMWFGPLPVRWLAVHNEVGEFGFVDHQVRGPLAHWQHRHTFQALDEQTTRIVDEITYDHHRGWRGRLTSLVFNRPGLLALFTFRKWATRWSLLPSTQRSQLARRVAAAFLLLLAAAIVASTRRSRT